jgi:hypothetical protein
MAEHQCFGTTDMIAMEQCSDLLLYFLLLHDAVKFFRVEVL